MNIKTLLVSLGLGLGALAFGQDMDTYKACIQKADQMYDSKEYHQSAEQYKAAFDALEGKARPSDRYNAACTYALDNNVELAFYHLFRLVDGKPKYKNYAHITTDTDLTLLHKDKRWKELISKVKTNKEVAEKDFDKPLVAQLERIHEEDQKYRLQLREIREKYGRQSEEENDQWQIIHKKDAENLKQVKAILDEKGWLGPKIVGDQGSYTLFLVIQHADLDTQIEYLPMIREAVKDKKLQGRSLAMLEDRVNIRQGNRQIYGSQITRDSETGEYYVLPLIDPEHVNERREKVGLGTLDDYVSHYNFTWNVEKHKKRTAAIEAKKKAETK